ncbi:MAG: leucine-rich repeat domain-containing protein [Prevotella sp.]|nr:leucine-rich repeat domain-containing protein [Prevotella sp.]
MKRFLLFVMMCVCVSIGAWAEQKLDNGNITIDVVGDVATINIKNGGGLNNVNDNDLQSYLKSCTTIVLKGEPSNEDYNKLANSWGFGNYTRLDLSGVTSNSTINCKNTVKVMILPAGKTAADVPVVYGSRDYLNYAIVNSSPLDVYVNPNDGNTGWVDEIGSQTASVHPLKNPMTPDEKQKYNQLMEAAEGHDNITTYDADNKLASDLNYPSDLNGGTLDNWLQTHSIKNLYVTGEMSDLSAFQGHGKKVAGDADFSGITNTDYSGLKIPDCGGKVILPGTVEYTDNKVTASSTATPEQVSAALAVLKNNGGPKWDKLQTVTFADGSIYDKSTKTLTLSSAAVESADENVIKTMSDVITGNGLQVEMIKTQRGSEYDSTKKTLNLAAGDDNYASGLKAKLLANSQDVEKVKFSTGSSFKYADGSLAISDADNSSAKISSLANSVGRDNITSLKLLEGSATVSNNKVTNVTLREDMSDDEKAALKQKLQDAGFDVNEIQFTVRPSSDDNSHVRVWIENGKVYVESDQKGELSNLLSANPKSQEALNAIEDLQSAQGATIVLQGAFSKADLEALTASDKGGNEAETVDMRNVTYTDANDVNNNMTFAPWQKTIKTAYISNDQRVTTIPAGAFQNMTNSGLKNLFIGNNVTTVPESRFENFTNLEMVDIPFSVTTIDKKAFKGCTNLSNVDFHGDACQVANINDEAFMNTGISGTFTVPKSVQRIEQSAFEGVNNMTALVIPKGTALEYIGKRAFWNTNENENEGLKNVYVEEDERTIDCHQQAFDSKHTIGQTNVATVTTRLHYPAKFYEHYVGSWRTTLFPNGVLTQASLDKLKQVVGFNEDERTPKDVVIDGITYHVTHNGWHMFVSGGAPVTSEWRTYCNEAPLLVPNNDVIKVYLATGYSENMVQLVRMKKGDVIPPLTGVVLNYDYNRYGDGVIFMDYAGDDHLQDVPYDNQYYREERNGKKDEYTYTMNGTVYQNYLRAIHTKGKTPVLIKNVEIAGGVKTYRNFFFGNGKKLADARDAGNDYTGTDWKNEYDTKGWGFFRAVSGNYNVNSKAYLHFPVDIYTDAQGGGENMNPKGDGDGSASAKGYGLGLLIEDFEEVLGVATTIESLPTTKKYMEGYYTLQGARISKPTTPGIYIFNGKKILVK